MKAVVRKCAGFFRLDSGAVCRVAKRIFSMLLSCTGGVSLEAFKTLQCRTTPNCHPPCPPSPLPFTLPYPTPLAVTPPFTLGRRRLLVAVKWRSQCIDLLHTHTHQHRHAHTQRQAQHKATHTYVALGNNGCPSQGQSRSARC